MMLNGGGLEFQKCAMTLNIGRGSGLCKNLINFMKQKIKYPLLMVYSISWLGFTGCDGADNDTKPETSYKVIMIDGCEYIYVSCRPFAREFSFTHKGNCKNSIHESVRNAINTD